MCIHLIIGSSHLCRINTSDGVLQRERFFPYILSPIFCTKICSSVTSAAYFTLHTDSASPASASPLHGRSFGTYSAISPILCLHPCPPAPRQATLIQASQLRTRLLHCRAHIYGSDLRERCGYSAV